MRTAQAVRKPLTRFEVWSALRTSLISAPFIVCIVFVVFKVFILSGLIVLFMRSFLMAPSGAWAIFALSVFLPSSILGIVFLIRDTARVRRLRKQGIVRQANLWFLTMFLVSLQLAIAPAVAMTIWAEMQTPDARIVNGKHHTRSPREQLVLTLKVMEARGTWTWVLKQ